jgi:putative N6-adenine-specific DNA methylase
MVLLSHYQGREYFCDPFCGSGTIVIEAALIAANRWPGLERKFAAEDWPQIPFPIWRDLRRQAREAVKIPPARPLVGYDIDPAAVALSRENAARARVGDFTRFQTKDIAQLELSGSGVIITNPPYGERLLDLEAARQLIRPLGALAQKNHWAAYVISPEKDFEHYYGRGADKRRKLYNGMIRCDLYMYYDPQSGVIRQIIREE